MLDSSIATQLYESWQELWNRDFDIYFALSIIVPLAVCYYCFSSAAKKRFTADKCTNVLITGGVQGLGKLLAEQFMRSSERGSVNLIVIDVRDDLAGKLLKDVEAIVGVRKKKLVHFYKANLADTN